MQHLLSSTAGLLHYLAEARRQLDGGARVVRVQTDSYTLEGKEAIDRLAVDLRAGRLTKFKLFDSVVGDREIEVNYHGN
jgi:hypothetical protein